MKKINTIILALLVYAIQAQESKCAHSNIGTSSSLVSGSTIIAEESAVSKESVEMTTTEDSFIPSERKVGDYIIPGTHVVKSVNKDARESSLEMIEKFLAQYTGETIATEGKNPEERNLAIKNIMKNTTQTALKEYKENPASKAGVYLDFVKIYCRGDHKLTNQELPALIAKLQTPQQEIWNAMWDPRLTLSEKSLIFGTGALCGMFYGGLDVLTRLSFFAIDNMEYYFGSTDDVENDDAQSEYESSESGSESGDEDESNSWFKCATFTMPAIWSSESSDDEE